MAIQFTDFSRAPLLDSPMKNIFENVLRGYQMSQEPAKMKEEQSARELANQLRSLEVEHKPKEYALNDQYKSLTNALQAKANEHYEEKFGLDRDFKKSQIEKMNEPTGALSQIFKLRDNLDPSDPNYDRDLTAINNAIANYSFRNNGAQSMQPGGGVEINLPGGQKGYISGLGNLQKGHIPVFDKSGKAIGVQVPMTPKQVDQWKAKEKFDVIYPFLNSSFSQYTGQNSWENFTKDVKNYKYDEEARDRVDNFLAARKLLSIGTTTENARIGGHATNVQLRELKNTLDSSEVNKRLDQAKGFVLPSQYAKRSGDIFKSYLDKVERTAKTNIPSYEFRALNPSENNNSLPANAPEPLKSNPEIVGTENGVTTIRNGGKTFKIPENMVDQYMNDHVSPEWENGNG